jgi:hypothetical protein
LRNLWATSSSMVVTVTSGSRVVTATTGSRVVRATRVFTDLLVLFLV